VRGDELILGACRDCSAALIVDRWTLRAPRCIVCAPGTGSEVAQHLDRRSPDA